MPRTIIDIPDAQLRDLDASCKALGISRAEAIRRAVDAFLRGENQQGGYGLWERDSVTRSARTQLKRRW
jgi:metal-responsive CopG/Arc/MetJ family transcriptional regulator